MVGMEQQQSHQDTWQDYTIVEPTRNKRHRRLQEMGSCTCGFVSPFGVHTTQGRCHHRIVGNKRIWTKRSSRH
jgi:hypothetical protein